MHGFLFLLGTRSIMQRAPRANKPARAARQQTGSAARQQTGSAAERHDKVGP